MFIYWSIYIAEIKSCTPYSFYIILLQDSCYNIWNELMLKYEKRYCCSKRVPLCVLQYN